MSDDQMTDEEIAAVEAMTTDELIALVKAAYTKTALIPSRRADYIDGVNRHYAGAPGVLGHVHGKGLDNFLPGKSAQWQAGFRQGFELYPVDGFPEGLAAGIAVAKAIFTWKGSPTIYSNPDPEWVHSLLLGKIDREMKAD